MVDHSRLWAALDKAQSELLAFRGTRDHWSGELSSSPLATATAISALVLAEQHAHSLGEEYVSEQLYQTDLSELLVDSLHWLAHQQNADGGWGDADHSRSNLATTMLVRAAFHLTGVPARYGDLLERADAYIKQQGGPAGLRKASGADRVYAALVLTNYALAELIPWRKTLSLPFEWTCLPEAFRRRVGSSLLQVAVPAFVAVGHARFHHRKPLNPLTRLLRRLVWDRSYQQVEQMQPASGGFLESIPLTSFVVMSLASSRHADSKVVRRGVEFLLAAVRGDGSWPLLTPMTMRNTAAALLALDSEHRPADAASVDWLLHGQRAAPQAEDSARGAWAWTDLPGGLANTQDTAAALLALAEQYANASDEQQLRIDRAAQAGVEWLLDLQNGDGGWPMFCRGWGNLLLDRSAPDLTSLALRALAAWRIKLPTAALRSPPSGETNACIAAPSQWLRALRRFQRNPRPAPALPLSARIDAAIQNGLKNLVAQQRPDGSWLALSVGNQFLPAGANPIYGTSQVLAAFQVLGYDQSSAAQQARTWLVSVQQADGGWGAGPAAAEQGGPQHASTVEETSYALAALAPHAADPATQAAVGQGLAWLIDAVEHDRLHDAAPLGFYAGKFWYHEQLEPSRAAAVALRAAATHELAQTSPPAPSPA